MLRNRAGYETREGLAEFEAASVTQRSEEPLPAGRLSVSHYRAIHRHLFQDVYDWAGKTRTVRLAKGGAPFCFPENIDQSLRDLFGALRSEDYFRGLDGPTFAQRAAWFLSELNAIHPFREGNGRAQNAFLALMAVHAGHPLDLSRMQPAAFLRAMVLSFGADRAALEDHIALMILEA